MVVPRPKSPHRHSLRVRVTAPEETWQESHATLQTFYEGAPFMMGLTELAGGKTVVISGNRVVADFLHKQPQELCGKTGVSLGNPHERLWVENYRRSQRLGRPVQFDFPGRRPAGECWFRATVAFIGGPPAGNPRFTFVVEDITERKRMEQALQARERQLQMALDASHAATWSWDAVKDISVWDERFRELHGLSAKELPSRKTMVARVHPADRQRFRTYALDLLKPGAGDVWDAEFRIGHPAKGERCIISRGQFKRDAAGRPLRLDGISLDITERKRIEQALQAREQQLQMALDASHAGTWSWDAVADVSDWDERYSELYGFSPDEPKTHKAWLARLHPADRRQIADHIAELLKPGAAEGWDVEFRAVHPVKGERWMLGVGQVKRDARGRPLRFTGINLDITERKRVEAELRQSEADLAEAQQLAKLGNWSLDLATNRIRWSNELYRIFEVEKTKFRGLYKSFLDRVHPDDRARVLRTNMAASRSGKSFEHEYRIVTRAGGWKTVRGAGCATRDASGKVVGLFGTVQDITERKQVEAQLHSYSQQLQALSQRIVQSQEAERRHLARELHDQVGQNLTAIQINLQTMLARPQTADVTARLQESLQLVDEVTQQLQDLSFSLRPLLLDDLGLLAALRWLMVSQGARAGLRTRFQGTPLRRRLDPAIETACFRIAQEAFTNILRHARATHVHLHLQLKRRMLGLKIRDNGVGFDLAATRTLPGASAGLGLLSMEERATLAGGRLEILTRPGEGTTLHARFPLKWRSARIRAAAGSAADPR